MTKRTFIRDLLESVRGDCSPPVRLFLLGWPNRVDVDDLASVSHPWIGVNDGFTLAVEQEQVTAHHDHVMSPSRITLGDLDDGGA